MDEAQQRQRMGGHEAASCPTYVASTQCRTRSIGERATRYYTTWSQHTRTPNCRPFKRRATPATITDKAGDGEDARSTKRPRRLGPKTIERSGGGTAGYSNSNRIYTSSIPAQLEPPPTKDGAAGHDERPSTSQWEATSGASANRFPEINEGSLLRLVISGISYNAGLLTILRMSTSPEP